MQVITGKYRARKLKSPDSARPTLQRIKVSLFSMLQPYIFDGCRVLDLFAGSGALGIECISRGASFCAFVDQDKKACKCISDNLKNIESKYFKIMNLDYYAALKMLGGQEKFDIIFLDPPYADNTAISAAMVIDRYDLLSDDGIIVIETDSDKTISIDSPSFTIVKDKVYGLTRIIILQKTQH